MYQIVVSYLESRFACFFEEEPITIYEELLYKIKDVVPYIKNIPSERIRVSYKDINLSTARATDEGIFINISPGDSLILKEAFRNAYDCGSESFKRVYIKVREVDSPMVARNRRGVVAVEENSNVDRATSSVEPKTGSRVEFTSRKKIGFQDVKTKPDLAEQDWKKDKETDINSQLEDRQNELYAVEAQLEEMNRPVLQPPQSGKYKTIICGNCHVRGHRSDGNKNNATCVKQPCLSYASCGQDKKHPEHFEEIRTLTKRCKQLKSEIDILSKDRQNLVAFQSKSISAFTTAVTNRLLKAFPDRYDPRTAIGKIKLQKDIVTIRMACNGKIPNFTSVTDDRDQFLDLLEEQQNRFDEVDSIDKRGYRESASISTNISPNFTNIGNIHKISSPVKVKKTKRNRRRKYSSSSSSDSDSSSSSSGSDIRERKHDEYYNLQKKHHSYGKKKRKHRKITHRCNSPCIQPLEDVLHVTTYNRGKQKGTGSAKGKETLPTHSYTKTQMKMDAQNNINETNIDENNDDTTPVLETAEASEITAGNHGWSLECLANVAENVAKL